MKEKRARKPDVSIAMDDATGVVTITAASPRGADVMLRYYGTIEDKGATHGYARMCAEMLRYHYGLRVATDAIFDAVTAHREAIAAKKGKRNA